MNTPDAAHESPMTLLEIATKTPMKMPDFIPPLPVASTAPDGPSVFFQAYQTKWIKSDCSPVWKRVPVRFTDKILERLKLAESYRIVEASSDSKVNYRHERPEGVYEGKTERRGPIVIVDEVFRPAVALTTDH